jgi:hypothetical protein
MSFKLAIRLVACLLLTAATACSPPESRVTYAPFLATYANLDIYVPDRPDLYQAGRYDFGLMVQICNRSGADVPTPLCQDLSSPLVNTYGARTYVKEPKAGTKFDLIKERSPEGIPPNPIPLVRIPNEDIDTDLLAAGEAYYLSRLNMGRANQWFTTSQGWPVAGCNRDHQGQHYCSVGFLRDGAFIEAHWFPERGVELTQLDIWLVAKAIDDKLLELVVQPTTQP